MKASIGLFALLLTVAASADAIAQKPVANAADLSGVYDIVFEMEEGHTQTSELTLTRVREGKVGGTVVVHDEVITLEDVVITDHTLTCTVTVPHGRISMSITFDGSGKFAGSYTMDGMGSGKVTGVRRKTK